MPTKSELEKINERLTTQNENLQRALAGAPAPLHLTVSVNQRSGQASVSSNCITERDYGLMRDILRQTIDNLDQQIIALKVKNQINGFDPNKGDSHDS